MAFSHHFLLALAAAAGGARAAPSSSQSMTGTVSGASASGAPTLTLTTAVASASAIPLASALPSQVALPPKQAWCPSSIFCAGELLQTLNLAMLFSDPKTIVDKPTSRPAQAVLSTFNASVVPNATEGAVLNFTDTNFKGEGLELAAVALPDFVASPTFLKNVKDATVRAWTQTVHGYWAQLIRDTNRTELCAPGSCESSLIPLNHTFVVPGGRFREQYYWDSFWIVQGLLRSQLYSVANGTLQNFMDELARFGFIPNGGRIYYLNRSQPPLFTAMLDAYVSASNDTAILARALPLVEAELAWWGANRAVSVRSPYSNKTHVMHRYAVTNTAPRPESYMQDYTTANSASPALNESAKQALYGELASGAETGWDYSSRWMADPTVGLTTLRVKSVVPVCLNSILYKAHTLAAGFYKSHPQYAANSKNASATAAAHTQAAAALKAGLLDLHWDASKLAFYDFILSSPTAASGNRTDLFSAATFYPYWNGIYPPEVLSNATAAYGAFSSIPMVLARYNGTLPVTFLSTGQQWDAPNAWPPHQYIALEALRGLPANVTSTPWSTNGSSTFSLVPPGQLGVAESALPAQPLAPGTNASMSGTAADVNFQNGTVVNGGNATAGEGWAAALQRALANRYVASALCSWQATGGSVPGLLPRLSDAALNVTASVNNTGNMFEKFSVLDIDSAGRGGEYTVQAGFGWTNGVVLWVADTYGAVLAKPTCPDLLASADAIGSASSASASGSSTASGSGSASASGTAGAGGSASASGTSSGASASATNGAGSIRGGAGWALGAGLAAVLLGVL